MKKQECNIIAIFHIEEGQSEMFVYLLELNQNRCIYDFHFCFGKNWNRFINIDNINFVLYW